MFIGRPCFSTRRLLASSGLNRSNDQGFFSCKPLRRPPATGFGADRLTPRPPPADLTDHGPVLSSRLHAEVIQERGLGALLRAVDAPDSAQFRGDLRPVAARVVAAPRADDLIRALGGVVPHALTGWAIDQLPPAQAHERGAIVVTGHPRADCCHGTILS